MNVCQMYVCVSFPFGFEGGVWDLIILIPTFLFTSIFSKCVIKHFKIVYVFKTLDSICI